MNYTTNYNLNKPEGTDLYNHLTIDNPNMDTIDAAMHANKLQAIGDATELVSGTVHAITRADGDQNIFRFKATGDFKVGDTITVDGVTVNAYTTGGQPLLNDAYVLSAEVVCILDGTSLWVLVNKTPDASEVDYDNSVSGLSAANVQNAIDEVNTELTRILPNNVWQGTAYNAGDTVTIPNFSVDKVYILEFKAFTSYNYFKQFIWYPKLTNGMDIEFSSRDGSLHCGYRLSITGGVLAIGNDSVNTNADNALRRIYEMF